MSSPRIVAVDATGEWLSVALLSEGKILGLRRKAARPHDELLLPAVDELLRRAGIKPGQLDAVAAASGPGRFTGIRVGMAYAAVASWSLRVPALAVSRLEALAWKTEGRLVCAALPGWREERYYQLFRRASAGSNPTPAGPPLWISAEGWREERKRLGDAAMAEADVRAEDLIAPALAQLKRRSRPAFAPLYLKPAGYEARK